MEVEHPFIDSTTGGVSGVGLLHLRHSSLHLADLTMEFLVVVVCRLKGRADAHFHSQDEWRETIIDVVIYSKHLIRRPKV